VGTLDPAAKRERELALTPAAAYRSIEWFWVVDIHALLREDSHTQALIRVARFLEATR